VRVLVDSCVWSLVLRRGVEASGSVRLEMERLIREGSVELIGPIRQEVLSGVRSEVQFAALKEALALFPEIGIHPSDYEEAARLYNLCRSRGVQGSGTDLLICAVAIREEVPVFTVDRDFISYAAVFPVPLHQV
jgi:predicted nucleic acid-binding protein